MCSVMVIDNNQMRRNWLHECIQNSNIKLGKIVFCSSCEDAEKYILKNNVDITIARLEDAEKASIELIKLIRKKIMFSIVLGYGICKNINCLCNFVNVGVSQYLQDVFDKNKLNDFLNEAYERYCTSKLKIELITKLTKKQSEKAYTDIMIRQIVDAFVRNAKTDNKKNVQAYVDILLGVMDNQKLYHSKSMILEFMIMITEQVGKGLIKTDYLLFNSKDFKMIMSFEKKEDLVKMVTKYLKKIANNIYMLSNAKDYKSLSIISATNYIKSHYNKDISRDDVADAVNLNPSYFSKFFKEQMGESFVSYLRRIRLEEAKTILEKSQSSIKTISERLGYSDSKYFSKLFYNYTGYTPYEYRKAKNSEQIIEIK